MNNKFKLIIFILSTINLFSALGQITPQGQNGKLVANAAVQVEQKIGKRFTSITTVAYSRRSQLNNTNVLQTLGFTGLLQDFSYRINKKWSVSQGQFYGRFGFDDPQHPTYLNEARLYPRLSYKTEWKGIALTFQFRTDFRFFYPPPGQTWNNPFEFRNRLLGRASIPIDKSKKVFFVVITELFALTDKDYKSVENGSGHYYYTPYKFHEDRTSFFVRYKFNENLFGDVGVLNQIWRVADGKLTINHQFSIDLVIVNPFSM